MYCVETAKDDGYRCCGMRMGNRTHAFPMVPFEFPITSSDPRTKLHVSTTDTVAASRAASL